MPMDGFNADDVCGATIGAYTFQWLMTPPSVAIP